MLLHDLKRRAVLHPEDADARCALGEGLLAEGQAEAATAQLEKAVALDPDHPRARRVLARAYTRAGRPTMAERALADQVLRRPDDPAARDDLAELLLGIGRVDDALVHLEEAIRVEPDHAPRRVLAADLAARRRLLERARGHLEHARRIAPGDAEVARRLQEVALELGDVTALYAPAPRGREILLGRARAALEQPPLREAVRAGALREAAAMIRRGDLALAKRALVAAPPEEQRGETYELLRAEITLLEGDPDRAARAFRRCVERAPGLALGWSRLGELCAAAGDHAEAARCYEAAIRIAPEDAENMEGLGDALAREGRGEEAIRWYERAIARRPEATLAAKAAGLRAARSPGSDAAPAVGRIAALGWSPLGGVVSAVEAAAVPGKGELIFTGNVGKVGQDAARVAASCLKARADALGIAREVATRDLHLHFVDTELQKDGPSAGLALALAGLSAFTGRPLRPRLAATGEVTLEGAVRQVSGLHEKIVAAYLAGVEVVLLPRRNLLDLKDLPGEVIRRVALVYVDSLPEAMRHALPPEEAAG
jgi:ATP-dependent Lon protease